MHPLDPTRAASQPVPIAAQFARGCLRSLRSADHAARSGGSTAARGAPGPRALRTASIVYLATLAVIGYFAVRRTRLGWWQQLVALGILVALGGLVILLQQLAHEH